MTNQQKKEAYLLNSFKAAFARCVGLRNPDAQVTTYWGKPKYWKVDTTKPRRETKVVYNLVGKMVGFSSYVPSEPNYLIEG